MYGVCTIRLHGSRAVENSGANYWLQRKSAGALCASTDYPKDATGRRPTGTGVVLVDVDPKTGWVTSARMEKSTGSKLLDDAAIAAFSRWRFRPGTVRQVHSPITFTHR
ncbi:MAG: hypothetical protein DME82_07100 [Verrucomicrobia bacterium]|nr:MAG: hypothetical protein DME82_07100 [Verrucomicrobiota bacterium]